MNFEKDVNFGPICRFCLDVSHKRFVLIDDSVRQMLNVLLVNMNLDVSDKPMICEDCLEVVRRSFSFKSMCTNSQGKILLFISGVDRTSVDMRDVFALNSNETVDKNTDICRLCIKKVEKGNVALLDVLLNDVTFSDMLKEYIFDMDLSVIKNPQICLHCQDDMKSYFKFLQTCRDTEDKIDAYRQSNIIDEGKVILMDVFETFSKDSKEEIDNSLTEIKKEFVPEEEGVIDSLLYQNEDKSDHMPCMCDAKDCGCNSSFVGLKETAPHTVDIKEEASTSDGTDHTLKMETEEIVVEKVTKGQTMYKCKLCPYKGNLMKSHMLTHRGAPNVQMYQCGSCEFQTKLKSRLKSHLLTHKNSSDAEMYKCDSCEFQTKYKGNLNNHLLTHKNSDVQIYQCDICEYQTKRKNNLKRHSLLSHEDNSDVQMYQCDSCDFKTKHKYNLKRHFSMTHVSDVQMYKCDSCDFKTKLKVGLEEHFLRIHSESSNVQMYQCGSCEFQTKYKNRLKTHLLMHEDSDVSQMYQCDSCEFQSKHKHNLKRHVSLSHKSTSDVEIYQCESCEFKTKYKNNLKDHSRTHKNSDAKMYQCDRCEFKTKYKNNLKNHSVVHKDFSEVQMYRCDNCEYWTRNKRNLRRHSVVSHRRSSDMQMSV